MNMASITVPAHFDGKQILLDEPYELKRDDKLLVTVLSGDDDATERDDWVAIAKLGLSRAYSDDEPEYTSSMIKEPNPKYEPR